MSKVIALTEEFVDFIPDTLEEGMLYISIAYATVVHKCCCGCGREVVTPLSPTDWKLIFDGKTVSLDPSIGNWNFPCKSHYWIRNNGVRWSSRWSREEIEHGRSRDRLAKERYFATEESKPGAVAKDNATEPHTGKRRRGSWRRLKWWS
jgi:Family of unknown function (DUF6527)